MYVIVNRLPLYDGPAFVTVQNIGDGAVAWRGRGRGLSAGAWETPERQFRLFDDPAHSFGAFSGVCFARAAKTEH